MELKSVIITLRPDQIEYLQFITTMYNISRTQQIRILIDKSMKEDDVYGFSKIN